jgi:hypothetical protein
MDPVALIVTALAAGVAAGVTDTASSAVKDAYDGLRALVKKQLSGRSDAELVLARYEQAPEIWRASLAAELDEVAAALDADLVAAAAEVMRLLDGAGPPAGKYAVDVRDAQGVQIGDHNRQDNVFNPPGSLRAGI